MKYNVIRTDTADAGSRKIILYIAQNFEKEIALERLAMLERRVLELGDNPYIGTEPAYLVLKRQGYSFWKKTWCFTRSMKLRRKLLCMQSWIKGRNI